MAFAMAFATILTTAEFVFILCILPFDNYVEWKSDQGLNVNEVVVRWAIQAIQMLMVSTAGGVSLKRRRQPAEEIYTHKKPAVCKAVALPSLTPKIVTVRLNGKRYRDGLLNRVTESGTPAWSLTPSPTHTAHGWRGLRSEPAIHSL